MMQARPGFNGVERARVVQRVAVLLTCHNRRLLTSRCLGSLFDSTRRVGPDVTVSVFLVDDGCTDGTGDAIRAEFPKVSVINGSGQLYWCGGMRLAWRHAAEGDYDAYLWLNDDVKLDEDGLIRMLTVEKEQRSVAGGAMIVVGSTRSERGQEIGASYGGMGPTGVLPPCATTSRIELFNGNIVLVTREAFAKLGNLSAAYTHGLGDIDYGIRARRAGVPVWLAPGCVGSCAANRIERWRQPQLSVWQRLHELHRPTGCPPWQLATLVWRNGGWWFPWSVAKLYFQAIFPTRASQAK